MIWDINNIPLMIEIVNKEIENGTTSLTKIATDIFGKNESTLRDAFKKAGYKRIDKKGIYLFDEVLYSSIAANKKPKNKPNSSRIASDIHKRDVSCNEFIADDVNPKGEANSECITTTIQKSPQGQNLLVISDLDVIALKELAGLVEPIKEVIEAYNNRITHDNVIEVEPIEIKLDDKIGVVGKAVGMRIDEEVYKEWQQFTANHKKLYKSHQLLSQALLEFMKKYK